MSPHTGQSLERLVGIKRLDLECSCKWFLSAPTLITEQSPQAFEPFCSVGAVFAVCTDGEIWAKFSSYMGVVTTCEKLEAARQKH